MSNMRGLTIFISDLRNARARDSEEKRINTELAKIRQKFRDTKLNGYERKKYICKLLYMYILGWDVDFGHLEAVKLISSTKYSEKQIGYLAVTLFLNEKNDLLHLVVNSIKKDMLDSNELFNCLALHCIANVGGREIGEALSADVARLLLSPTSNNFVKKKAALTLSRLYRKWPRAIEHFPSTRIISLLNDSDLGVVLSATTLLIHLAQDQAEQYHAAFSVAARRLRQLVVDNEYGADYLYYTVPIPWLQINLLRLLSVLPKTKSGIHETFLENTLQKIIDTDVKESRNVQESNAQNAILFQAIKLVVQLETAHLLLDKAIDFLAYCLSSRETNVRYLGLEGMSHLTMHADLARTIKTHQNTVIKSLKDRDISVRRRGLDLLYSMTDGNNAKDIISELIRFLQTSEYAMREEMVIKIAILVEKYTTEFDWYVTVTLKLLAIAGDHVPNEVWQRTIQIIANNESLQQFAARSVLTYMKLPSCHENLVRVGAFVIGEFGHLIADSSDSSPIEQFSALHTKFNTSTLSTRAMLMTTYLKLVNLFPEIKEEILLIFQQFYDVMDPELQQRACEYLTLVQMPDTVLLEAVCEEMPPYPEIYTKSIASHYV